jgi:lipoprotein-releasing system permease protein
MRLPFSFFLAMKYLRPKRSFTSVVTVISILGVLLGVAILVIVLSVMTGFDNMWRDKILSFKPHLMVTSMYGPVEEEEALCQRIESIEGITGAAPTIQTRVLLQHEGALVAPVVLGAPSDRVARISRVTEHMHSGTFSLDADSMVLGIDLAGSMGIRVGDTVLLYSPMNVVSQDEMTLPEELTVSGIFDMGMRDFDSGFVFTSLDVARDLVGMDSGAHGIYVMTDDAFRADEYAEALREALGPSCAVQTWQQTDRLLFDALRHEKAMMFVLLVFITIVAIFCVTNTLIVITVRKTNEIGLLKALGFSSLKIMGAFVWLGWIQCLIGIAGGIGTGLLVLNNLGNIVAALTSFDVEVFPKAIYGLSEIPWSASPREIIDVAAFVMVFCTLSSLLPAWRAARLDPVQALRQE